ncbi:hypothetical protein [Isachenkonia alkalipeptolytica]|uniref:DUF4064 domain-containing protein n=1 Tax=Isachenkonia alkalipeptolytica TaxID=2565777 RepID=A0AA44BF35_9CLOT|nr:hypothetical protein [Isachenkonia alkalipeptolytica]NBG88181.1 hypothetical protein [Isachenkonia alkalipeptolytica]
MQKTGGIIAMVAGAIVVVIAFATLIFGGGIDWEALTLVEDIGWGGLFFSFLVIIFGTMAITARDKIIGILLILSAILAAILGGLFVAVFMVIALIGGVMATMEMKNKEENRAA